MELLKFAIKTAEKAGKLAEKMAQKSAEIKYKAKKDIVTTADLACQELIIQEIKSAYPSHTILAEEKGFSKLTSKTLDSEYIWIIDPIDGTLNYSRHLGFYAVSIALLKTNSHNKSKNFDYIEGEVIIGVVYAPALKQLFYAQKGKGAFLNKKKLKISPNRNLEKSCLATGFPRNSEENLPYFAKMMNQCEAIRRFGSAAIDLAYTAAGFFDGYWEFGLKAWDIAAGALIVKEAGGLVTDVNGNQLDLFGGDILASNGYLHKKIIDTFEDLPA